MTRFDVRHFRDLQEGVSDPVRERYERVLPRKSDAICVPDRQGRGDFGRSKAISVRTTCVKDGGREKDTPAQYSVLSTSGGLIGSEVENERA